MSNQPHNTPLNTDDELRGVIDEQITEAVNAAVTYRESGLIDQSAYETFMNNHIEMATDQLMKQIESDRKQHELEARINEHSLWKPVAEEIVRIDGVYRAVNFLNARASQLNELKQELEKL